MTPLGNAVVISTLLMEGGNLSKADEFADCYEYRSFSARPDTDKPKIFHSDLRIERPLGRLELGEIRRQASLRKYDIFSLHLACDYEDPAIRNDMYVPSGKRYEEKEIFLNALDNVRKLRDCLPHGTEPALENNNYYPTGAYDMVTKAGVINRILSDNRLGLVLDLAHLRITSHNRRMDAFDHLKEFSLDDCLQVHVSGCRLKDGIMTDAHDEPDDSDWKMLDQVLDRCANARYVTIEFYKSIGPLLALNARLSKILKDRRG